MIFNKIISFFKSFNSNLFTPMINFIHPFFKKKNVSLLAVNICVKSFTRETKHLFARYTKQRNFCFVFSFVQRRQIYMTYTVGVH